MNNENQTALGVVVILVILLSLGLLIGYFLGQRNEKTDAIRAGVAHYVVVNKESPVAQFQYITNTSSTKQ